MEYPCYVKIQRQKNLMALNRESIYSLTFVGGPAEPRDLPPFIKPTEFEFLRTNLRKFAQRGRAEIDPATNMPVKLDVELARSFAIRAANFELDNNAYLVTIPLGLYIRLSLLARRLVPYQVASDKTRH